jgi:hypothetical protein
VVACRQLIRQNRDNALYQAACLRKLVGILGQEAFDDLAAAAGAESAILRRAAIKLARDPELSGLEKKWAEELGNSKGDKRQAILEIIPGQRAAE